MASSLDAKQMRQLLQSISTDPQLRQSKDSILLAEDQYPDALDAIFTKLKTPTTLQNSINLLQWDRKATGGFDAELKHTTIISQNSMRAKYQLTPTRDNPWDTYTFRQWKYFVTNICLSAVQDALRNGDNSKTGMQHLFAPDKSDKAAVGHHSTKNNVQGMLLYHPILLQSPWQAPDDINKRIVKLLETSEPTLVARSKATNSTTNYDKDNAIKQLESLAHSIKQSLLRIYDLASHSFHVLLLELIPLARFDKSSLFTHIKGARTEHILNLRAHHGKTRGTTATALTKEQLKPHSAAHTLAFIEKEYVEVDDNAEHFTWSDIMTATRQTRMTIFAWVDSFTLLKLRYGETVTAISAARITKINNIISKQITDDEKSIITTLNPTYSAIDISNGNYELTDLLQLLAQNVTSFTKQYASAEHPRIGKYLRTRSTKYKHLLEITTQGGKGKGQPIKKQKLHNTSQRAWAYLEEPTVPHLFTSTPYPKGKGIGKGKSKGGKGKGLGKGLGKGKPSFVPKGKGKGKSKGKSKGGKGKRTPKGNPFIRGPAPGLPAFNTQTTSAPIVSTIRCHFCHAVGHIKPNCRKWLALSQNERYQQRNSHETKYQMIYDHLEDSVLAPRFCQYCSDSNCDGQNCESPFDYNDYNEASVFFTQSLSDLVVNAKLDRPLDSHAPQTEHMYYYGNDDWGEQHEHGEDQWEYEDEQWYDKKAEETYAIEEEYQDPLYDQDQDEDGEYNLEEDDQDNYE